MNEIEQNRLLRLEGPRIAAFAHLLEMCPGQNWIKSQFYGELGGKQSLIVEARQANFITITEMRDLLRVLRAPWWQRLWWKVTDLWEPE